MKKVIKSYKDALMKYGHSPKSLFILKNNQNIRFESMLNHIKKDESFSLLDYGCGLGDLKRYLNNRFGSFKYTGVDIVEDFILHNKKIDTESEYFLIDSVYDIKNEYDHIIIVGVFNMLYDKLEKHKNIVFESLEHLFNKSRKSLIVNFLSPYVDYIQKGAYHQDDIELMNFVRRKLSRRFFLDHSFMPYEYSITIFKENEIDSAKSAYKDVVNLTQEID